MAKNRNSSFTIVESKVASASLMFFGLAFAQNSSAQCGSMILASIVGPSSFVAQVFADAEMQSIADQIRRVTVQLNLLDKDGNVMSSCGGWLRDNDKVVTTAHCFANKRQKNQFGKVEVIFSSDVKAESENNPKFIENLVMTSESVEFSEPLLSGLGVNSKAEFLRDFSKTDLGETIKQKGIGEQDIAMIRLPAPIYQKSEIAKSFSPARVSVRTFLSPDQTYVIAGSGTNFIGRKVTGERFYKSDFKTRFSILKPGEYIIAKAINGTFGFVASQGFASCKGDSGSPIFRSENGVLEVIGMNSASDCNTSDKPDFSTMVLVAKSRAELDRIGALFEREKIALGKN